MGEQGLGFPVPWRGWGGRDGEDPPPVAVLRWRSASRCGPTLPNTKKAGAVAAFPRGDCTSR